MSTILSVVGVDGSVVHVAPDEEAVIKRALRLWAESGKTRDTLLELMTRNGAEYSCLASRIDCIVKSTPETRQLSVQNDRDDELENVRYREIAGYPASKGIPGLDDG